MSDNKVGRPIYRKHNSFVALTHRHAEATAGLLARLATLCDSSSARTELSADHAAILDRVLADLFDPPDQSKRLRFALSPSVVEEMLSYDDDSVFPRYLVHRYRYEMFPQLQLVDAYPPYVQIEPSSICNYRCVFCFETDESFTRKSNGFMGHMSLDQFKQIVDQIQGHVEFVSLASRGEPMLCPDIVPMLEYTAGKFLNLKVNTNASMLDEAKCHAILAGGVKTLVFSADAATEPLYGKLRVNGKLDKVLANIENFQNIRELHYPNSKIITRVSGVKISENQEITDMERVWGGLVDQVAFVAYNPWENTYDQAPNSIVEPCSDLWRRMFIWWDGKVNPCDVDYKSTLCVGNILDSRLSALWQSNTYRELRDRHRQGERRRQYPCNCCTVT